MTTFYCLQTLLIQIYYKFQASDLEAPKFWPMIGRIDDAYGDQNLMCSCPPISTYQHEDGEVRAAKN